VDVGSCRIIPAPESLPGALERTAVLEEVAVLDAIDPDVGCVPDLVVGAQGLGVARCTVAAHEV
jgi:hypothetical protein